MKCEQLFTCIDNLQEKYIDIWEELCLIESPTEHKAGVDAAGRYIAEAARRLGFDVKTFMQERAGDVVSITMNKDATLAPVIFSGHIDTVHAVGAFGTPAVTRKDGRLHGPGVADCKGGVVASLMAMHALRDVGFPTRPIKLILQTDEENGSLSSGKDTLRILLEESRGAIAFLNCEATRGASAVMTRKGIVRFTFTVKGKAAHASKCPEGVSAICEAAHKIIELEAMKDMDAITCSCGLISGGTASNTVPDACTFEADFRFHTDEQVAYIRNLVRRIADTSHTGASSTVEEISYRPAMVQSEKNDRLLDQMNRIYRENGMPELIGRLSLGGSDASYTTNAGIPTVDSIGVDGDFVHTPREYAVIRSLSEAAKRVAAIAYCIQE